MAITHKAWSLIRRAGNDAPVDDASSTVATVAEHEAKDIPVPDVTRGAPNWIGPNTTLQQERRHDLASLFDSSISETDLPPVDTGKQAWLLLSACWVFEAMIYGNFLRAMARLKLINHQGFAFSFGIFQDHYSRHEPFHGQVNIAVIGTTNQGILYFGTPFITPLCRMFAHHTSLLSLVGVSLATLALAMASFCNTVPQLIGVQGVLFGIGGCLAYAPCIIYIDEWFDKRKGLAYGIAWSAAGVGGVVLPLVLEFLLTHLEFRMTLRICAAAFFALTAPCAFFVRPRIPRSMASPLPPFNIKYIFSGTFVFYWLIVALQGTGYFLPTIYLPSYATHFFGASHLLSVLTLMILNISATLGCVIMGFMTDKLNATTCVFVSALGSATSVILVWGLTTKLAHLYIFAMLYGVFAGGYTSIYSGIMRNVTQKGKAAGYGHNDPMNLMGGLLLGRGIGNLVSGPLSEALIKSAPWEGQLTGGFGSGYGAVILFTSVTAFAGMMVLPLKAMRWL